MTVTTPWSVTTPWIISDEPSSARVVSIDWARSIWRPVKMCCFWCGHSMTGTIADCMPLPCVCADCGLAASIVTHEAPDGWSRMSNEELAERDWVPVR